MKTAHSRRRLLTTAALGLTLALGACGDDDDADNGSRSQAPPAPLAGGRFENRGLTFEATAARPSRRGSRWDVAVRLRLTNRGAKPLRIGQLSADLEDRRGKTYPPVRADGRDVPAPVFAEGVVPPGRTASSTAVYRVPLQALPGADLQVRDEVRGQRFELSLF